MKKAEKEHVNAVADLGCIACYVQSGMEGTPCAIHHTRFKVGAAQRSSWFDVIGLCPEHHQHGSAEKIAYHREPQAFEEAYGTEEYLLKLTYDMLGKKYE